MTSRSDRIPSHPSIPPQVPQVAPRRRMLMTPQLIVFGGLMAFFAVVLSVVVLPVATYRPPHSENWLPLSDAAFHGRAVFLANGCMYCHSGYSRPQDVFEGLYYTYPRVSEPGDFRGENQSPNALGSARTGPDLSQDGGQHPDGWHRAHYQNPRNTTPISIMPSFSYFSSKELENLIAYNQSRGGKQATLRYAVIRLGNSLMRMNMGMQPDNIEALDALVSRLKKSGEFREKGKPMQKSPSGLPWKAVWMTGSFARDYWLVKSPLQVTQQNLIRGKAIFLKRCSGCHGEKGDGAGPAASSFKIPPFDFTADSVSKSAPASTGMFYYRILTGGKGTAMENFGTRLSVEDTWRVAMFLRTIHKGGLREPLPTVDMFEPWTPPPPLLDYVDNHPIRDQVIAAEETTRDPFMMAAQWIEPGMAPNETVYIGGQLPMTLQRLAALVRADYTNLIEADYAQAKARGEPLPSENDIESTKGLEFHAP